MRQIISLLGAFISCVSCSDNILYSQYQDVPEKWAMNDTIQFNFKISDDNKDALYQTYINLRNDNSFPFSNIFLRAELNFPSGKSIVDTLEYPMANAQGEWLGTGITDVKQNLLWYKEGNTYPEKGDYQLKISHLMRKNGSLTGINNLMGILDIGCQIKTQNP